jgi:parvulin-like peptidyl-prolyl isomerase
VNLRLPLVSAALAGLLLTACGDGTGTASANAATVNADSISDRSFTQKLRDYEDNELFLQSQQAGAGLQGPAPGTVSNEFARDTLRLDILFLLAAQENERRGIDTTGLDPDEVLQQTIGRFSPTGDAAVFEAFPESFQEEALDQTADAIVLQETLLGITEAQLQAAYDADPDQFTSVCASHILVETEAEAQAVLDRLESGEDFATVAEEVSIDTGSAVNGGSLNPDGTCVPASTYVPEFAEAATTATPGEPVGPVQTQFGYHVILVEKVEPLPFEQARPAIEQSLVQANQQTFQDWLRSALGSDIWVNPRYGTWDGEGGLILPPGLDSTNAPTTVVGGSATTEPVDGAATTVAGG